MWTLIRDVRFQRRVKDLAPTCQKQARQLIEAIQADPETNDGRVPELLRKLYPTCMKRRMTPPCAYVLFFRVLREHQTIVLVDIWAPPRM